MNFMLHARYPGHVGKQAIQVFTSAEIPKRPDYVKELGSIVYYDSAGTNVDFLFEVPDDRLAEFTTIQAQRSAFLCSRVNGFVVDTHAGLNVMAAIKQAMPLMP